MIKEVEYTTLAFRESYSLLREIPFFNDSSE